MFIFFLLAMAGMFATNKKNDETTYKILFIILLGMLCLRYGQGTDYIGYQLHYSLCPSELNSSYFSANGTFEKGYRFLMNVCKSIGFSFELFVALISIFEMLMLNRFIKKYCGHKCIALLLFFPSFYLTYYFSALRQGIALSIFIGLGVPLIMDKKWLKYIILTFVVASIHKSAYVMLLIPLLINIKPKSLLIIAVIMLGAAIVLNAVGIYSSIANLLDKAAYENSGIGWSAIVRKAVEFVLVIILYKDRPDNDDFLNIILKIYYIGIIVAMFFYNNALILGRLTIYFDVMLIALVSTAINNVALPNIAVHRLSSHALWTYTIAVILLTGFMTIRNIDSYVSQGRYYNENFLRYPYISIFEKEDLYSYRTSNYKDLIDN